MPRFVILEHDHPKLHWDLMLEVGPSLKTWRLARFPDIPGELIEATPLGEHRLAYLDYEGPVSGGRGFVKKADEGTYEFLPLAREGEVTFLLTGKQIRGIGLIQPMGPRWIFSLAYAPDPNQG